MPAEESRCSNLLGIPEDLLSVWSAEQCSLPVWTFVKQQSGYSPRVFWRSKDSPAPNNAHPGHPPSLSRRKLRSKKRLKQFISKKKAKASESSSVNNSNTISKEERLPPAPSSANTHNLRDTGSVKLSVPDVRSTVVKSKTGDTCTSDKNNTCLTESLHSDILVHPLVSASLPQV